MSGEGSALPLSAWGGATSAPKEVVKRDAEGSGDAEQNCERRVGRAPLEPPQDGSTDSDPRRGVALRPAARLAQTA